MPSKLYYTKTTESPLAGYRIGIKDIYDIAGVKTSNGNRAWYHLYPAANVTAPAVQKLIDAGAIVVGKMITSQFANGETATADWVDYHEPFNPRGDGYQDTSSSSAGPGAGEAAYPWLDITLGSDSGGSIRGPAQEQGIYGNRPTHGAVTLDHVMPLSPVLDTSGLLCRDPAVWRAFAEVLYEDNANFTHYSAYPKTIYTMDLPTSADNIADGLVLNFLANLTAFLGAKVEAIDYDAMFAANPPAASTTDNTTTLLNLTYSALIGGQQSKLVRDPFYAGYGAIHDGRLPFVDPVPLLRWNWADSQPAGIVDEAINNKTIFRDWFQSNILINAPNSTTCSNAIAIYVGSTAGTVYRNGYRAMPGIPAGWAFWVLSPIVEVPDYVVPVGQAPYNSTITQHVEFLPVTIDLMVAKNCDFMLFDLINDLEQAGIIGVSTTGYSDVDGGEILYRRDL